MYFRQQYTDPQNDHYLAMVDAVDCSQEKDRTLQQYKEEVDIKTMVRRFGITGQPPNRPAIPPSYGDFTGVGDYQTALNAVDEARRGFMSLPSDIRKRFDHDPGQLLAFVQDGRNYDEAVKLGLVPAPPPPARDVVKVEDLPE